MRTQSQYIRRAFALFAFIVLIYVSAFAQPQINVLTSEHQKIEHIGGLVLDKDVPFEDVQEMIDSFYWWEVEGTQCIEYVGMPLYHPMKSYWWHFLLQNETDTIENWVINTGKKQTFNIYTFKNDRFIRTKSGQYTNYAEKSYPKDDNVFSVQLLPREQVELFVKKTNLYGYHVDKSEQYHWGNVIVQERAKFKRSLEIAFLFVTFFLSIFTFLQLLIHKDKAYAYYAFYLLMIGSYFLYRYESVWGHPIVFMNFYKHYILMEPPMTFGLILVYALFAQSFVALNSSVRKGMDLTIKYLKYAVCMALLIHCLLAVFYEYNTIYILGQKIRQILFFFTLPILYFLFKNGTKLSYVFLVGTLFLLLGVLATFWVKISFAMQDMLGLSQNSTSVVQIAMIFEFLCFSTALGYKTKLTQDEKNRIERELSVTELKALKAQLHPHFIFNSMNSIKNFIIKKDNDKADEYLVDFAKLLRLTLLYSEKQSITLDEEIEFAELYIKAESLRFKHSFDYQIIVEDSIDTESIKIPPLIFQLYIENAIEHGLLAKEGKKKLKIEIQDKGKYIICAIDDNGIGREKAAQINTSPANHTSVGTKLNQQRIDLYNALREDNINVSIIDKPYGEGTRVEIFIPTNYDNL